MERERGGSERKDLHTHRYIFIYYICYIMVVHSRLCNCPVSGVVGWRWTQRENVIYPVAPCQAFKPLSPPSSVYCPVTRQTRRKSLPQEDARERPIVRSLLNVLSVYPSISLSLSLPLFLFSWLSVSSFVLCYIYIYVYLTSSLDRSFVEFWLPPNIIDSQIQTFIHTSVSELLLPRILSTDPGPKHSWT